MNWKLIAFFALAGPPVGAVLLAAPGAINQFLNALVELNAYALPGLILVWGLPIAFSFLFGLVPAALTGAAISVAVGLAHRANFKHIVMLPFVGALAGGVFTYLFHLLVLGGREQGFGVPLELVGATSGALCSLAALSPRMSPNNSFKPKPLRGSA